MRKRSPVIRHQSSDIRKFLTSDVRRLTSALRQQRANAVLFSLIIMASAMVISLGMVTLVANEARSVSLVLPAERAYYKAESYVEQAMWQKKQDPSYQIAKQEDLPSNFLCEPAGCDPFSTKPTGKDNDDLSQFVATTSPVDSEIGLRQDIPQQLDISTTGVTGTNGTITLEDIVGEAGYQGMEVTIIAYPKATDEASLAPQFPINDPLTSRVEQATTPVFVDKVYLSASTPEQTISIDPAQPNPVGENYPAINADNVYRLRLKALGANATAKVAVGSTTNGELNLVSPDFTVRAVAQDGTSQRGIQVLFPASEQTASIFDFVLFSDLDLNKTGKKPAGAGDHSIQVEVLDDDGDCLKGPGDVPIADQQVTINPEGQVSSLKTDAQGVGRFDQLQSGATYSLQLNLQSGTQACPPGAARNVMIPSGNPDSSEVTKDTPETTFLVQPKATLGAWIATTPMAGSLGGAVARFGHASVFAAGRVYTLGGNSGSAVNNQSISAPINGNGTLGTWSSTSAMRVALYFHDAVGYGCCMYTIGGLRSGAVGYGGIDKSTIGAGGTLSAWSLAGSIPARYWTETVMSGDKMYIIGGYSGGVDQSTVYRYTAEPYFGGLSGLTTVTALPLGIRTASAVAANGYIYLIGGINGSTNLSTVYRTKVNADGSLGGWTTTSSLPAPRCCGAAVVMNGYIYLIGGAPGPTNTVFYSRILGDGSLGPWNTTTSLPGNRYHHTSVTNGSFLYTLGGAEGDCNPFGPCFISNTVYYTSP